MSQEDPLPQGVIFRADNAHPTVLHLICIANGTKADRTGFDCVFYLGNRRHLVDDPGRQDDATRPDAAQRGLQVKAALTLLEPINATCDSSSSIAGSLPLEPLQQAHAAYAFWKPRAIMSLRNEFGACIASVEHYRGSQKSSEIHRCSQSCRTSANNRDLIPFIVAAGHHGQRASQADVPAQRNN